jgi:uncharacterized protein (TIGR02145 family)
MKKLIFLTNIILFGILTGLQGQKSVIELTFTAVYHDQYVALDSILIQNLSQGGDTMLYAPDHQLMIDITTGLTRENQALSHQDFALSQNYPNPFSETTAFTITTGEKSDAVVRVTNLFGVRVAFLKTSLDAGKHRFTFHSGNDQFYLLFVTINGITKSLKMISNGYNRGTEGMLSYSGSQADLTGLKSHITHGFLFTSGDRLRFTGYATTETMKQGSNELEDNPESSTTYVFDIIEGIRCPGMPLVYDPDGNVYNTVLIGSQCWMKENLKTTTYSNGTSIPNVTDINEWSSLVSGAFVWYSHDISWKDSYGALYNWYVTNDSTGVCPTGWHVPGDDEWSIMTDFIGGIDAPHGNMLKSCRQMNSSLGGNCNTNDHPRWNYHSTHYGTDDYGFSAFPGGYRNNAGPFFGMGISGYFWSSSECTSAGAWVRNLNICYGDIQVCSNLKQNGYSIRCLRDN